MRPITKRDLLRALSAKRQSKAADSPLPTRMAIKDWMTLTISLFAFAISALTAYWTVIREVDDVRVMILGHPDLTLTESGIKVGIGNMRLGFVNMGNRVTSITSIELTIDQALGKEDCTEVSNEYTMLDIPPLIVEAGKIDVRAPKLAKSDFSVPLSKENLKAPQVQVTACLGFEILTPAKREIYKRVSVGTNYVLRPLISEVQLQAHEPQHVLYQRWGTIFGKETQ
jgi:hypothetical protein